MRRGAPLGTYEFPRSTAGGPVEAYEMADSKHLAQGIGCTKCHGPSKEHVADEINEVKPDHTFTREQIDSFCGL